MAVTVRETVLVVLDVTVSPSNWEITYGGPVPELLPEYVLNRAREAPRLTVLVPGAPTADVTLLGSEVTAESKEWVTMRLVLEVALNGAAWRMRWGVPPDKSVGAHVAAFLAGLPTMANEVDATVIYDSQRSGRVLASATYRRRVARDD